MASCTDMGGISKAFFFTTRMSTALAGSSKSPPAPVDG